MINLTPEIQEFLSKSTIWTISTQGEKPLGIPTRFHSVSDDGKLVISRVFMKETIENLKNCDEACVSVFTMEGHPEGYLVRGKAEYVTEGKYAELAAEMTKPLVAAGGKPIGGAVVITPEKVSVASPGPHNGEIIA